MTRTTCPPSLVMGVIGWTLRSNAIASFGSVLPGLANFPINRVAELTPSAWANQDLTVEIRRRRQTDVVPVLLKGRERWFTHADNADTDKAARALRDRLGP